MTMCVHMGCLGNGIWYLGWYCGRFVKEKWVVQLAICNLSDKFYIVHEHPRYIVKEHFHELEPFLLS